MFQHGKHSFYFALQGSNNKRLGNIVYGSYFISPYLIALLIVGCQKYYNGVRLFRLNQPAQIISISIWQVSQKRLNLLLDIDARLQAKGSGYQRWATVYNLKQMAQTMIFLREHGIENIDQLHEKTKQSTERFDQLDEKIKTAEKRLVEIASLKKHIINYAKTKDVYVDYRKSGYSRKFYESHREAITLHKAAKDAFNELGIKKLPKVKDLSAEYAEVLADKKAAYAQYRNARTEMQDYLKAQKNVEQFLNLTRQEEEKAQEEKRKEETQR